MPATWSAPRTWVTGDTVTASLLNTHIRDELLWLKTPTESGKITFASDFTTTSATYVDITGVTATITTNGGGVDVTWRCTFGGSGTAQIGFLLLVDGVSEAVLAGPQMLTTKMAASFTHHIAALSAGVHTIKVQAKTAAGTLTIYGTTGTTGDPLFFVREAGG